jgi:hypothetical protein
MGKELISIGFERPGKDYSKKYQAGLWLNEPNYSIWWDGVYFYYWADFQNEKERLLHNVKSIGDVKELIRLLS